MADHYDSIDLPKKPLTDANGDVGAAKHPPLVDGESRKMQILAESVTGGSRDSQGEKTPRQSPEEGGHHGRARAPTSPPRIPHGH